MAVIKMEQKRLVALTSLIVTSLLLGGVGVSKISFYEVLCDNSHVKAHMFMPNFGEIKLLNNNNTVKSCDKFKEYLIPHSNAHLLICKYEEIEGINIELYLNNTISILNVWSNKTDIISFITDILNYSILL